MWWKKHRPQGITALLPLPPAFGLMPILSKGTCAFMTVPTPPPESRSAPSDGLLPLRGGRGGCVPPGLTDLVCLTTLHQQRSSRGMQTDSPITLELRLTSACAHEGSDGRDNAVHVIRLLEQLQLGRQCVLYVAVNTLQMMLQQKPFIFHVTNGCKY